MLVIATIIGLLSYHGVSSDCRCVPSQLVKAGHKININIHAGIGDSSVGVGAGTVHCRGWHETSLRLYSVLDMCVQCYSCTNTAWISYCTTDFAGILYYYKTIMHLSLSAFSTYLHKLKHETNAISFNQNFYPTLYSSKKLW